ncbi:MAG: class I SAM-dependent methyltransferase [Planctomycetia bacterium]|nr:class I SAM-dependent methyltransferase [Planctomycetia bacterium]
MNATVRDPRGLAALRRHYEVEKELADRLRAAPAEARPALYRSLYNELFARVPDHPQNVWKDSPTQQTARTNEQMRLLERFLTPETVYLEVGAGDCHLTRTVAGKVKAAYGVDVSDLISATDVRPANFDLLITDGTTIPLEASRVTVAYSNMLVEHLHPDDCVRHLQEVHRVLAPGGVYVCRTPHRFAGPTDISGYFDREATGFHMKEYSFREVDRLFRAAGFESVGVCARVKGKTIATPTLLVRMAEWGLGLLPYWPRKALSRSALLRPLFSTVTVVARKK